MLMLLCLRLHKSLNKLKTNVHNWIEQYLTHSSCVLKLEEAKFLRLKFKNS